MVDTMTPADRYDLAVLDQRIRAQRLRVIRLGIDNSTPEPEFARQRYVLHSLLHQRQHLRTMQQIACVVRRIERLK